MADNTYASFLDANHDAYSKILSGYTGGGGGSSNLAPGGLPAFDSSGGNFDFTGNPANLSANYKTAYQGAAGFNQQLGNTINQGWGQLGQNVQGLLADQGQEALAMNNKTYAGALGNITQSAINSGLGNATVQYGLQTGVAGNKAIQDRGVLEQVARDKAGAMMQIGQGQLGFLNSIQAPYPNAALYGQLGQQWGAAQQAQRNQAQAADQFKQLLASSQRTLPGGSGGGGTVNSGAGPMPSKPFNSGSGGGQWFGSGYGILPSESPFHGVGTPGGAIPQPLVQGGGGDWGEAPQYGVGGPYNDLNAGSLGLGGEYGAGEQGQYVDPYAYEGYNGGYA